MTLSKKKVPESRMVVQFHFTRWPDHRTPNRLNLIMFLRLFQHKIRPNNHPIIVNCSAGIGRTGTFIALDVLSRYGEEHDKINVIEFVKAMRKDRRIMIQNADQYAFLYYALYEYFRRKENFISRTEFMELYGEMKKPETRKRLRNEFNSFTRAEELISAQYPVSGAAIDIARLLIDQTSSFLISMNPLSEINKIKDWVDNNIKKIDLAPCEISKSTQQMVTNTFRKTDIKIKRKQ
ncbi:receptor-type tyrosine-protein phosphatase mu-like, partial [Saccostrea cucullata]|uniref:receptor-type tyrosine-protein phosphatase mu-like n=1 Tax=Saccostrea cuccullata TaxID=36930 RepID=UPI002ED3C8E9